MRSDLKARLSEASTILEDEHQPRKSSLQLLISAHISSNENIGKVIYMGVCFLILFTAFTSIQSLMSEIYTQLGHGSLGQITLLVLYTAVGFTILIAPGLLKNWTHRQGVFIGALTYILTFLAGAMTTACATVDDHIWCGSNLFIYGSHIAAASINGFGAAILWLAVNRYITACANESNKGRFMGIFFSFFASSNVVGSLMAAFVIEDFGQFGFYIVNLALAIIAIVMIFFAREIPKYDDEDFEESMKEKAVKIFRLAFEEKMRPLLPYLFFVGLVLAVYNGFEYEIIMNTVPNLKKEDQDFITAMVFLAQGLVSIISSYGAGRLDDIMKRNILLFIFNVCFVIAIVLSFLSYFTDSLILTFVMGVLWGIGYSGALTLTGVIMAKDFYGSIEAYAVLQLVCNIATIVGFVLCIYITHITTFLFVIIGFLTLSLVCTYCYKPKDRSNVLGVIDDEEEN